MAKKRAKKRARKSTKKRSTKARASKGKIPLKILEKRASKLVRLVKSRGGTVR
jgi:hypothetical protein